MDKKVANNSPSTFIMINNIIWSAFVYSPGHCFALEIRLKGTRFYQFESFMTKTLPQANILVWYFTRNYAYKHLGKALVPIVFAVSFA